LWSNWWNEDWQGKPKYSEKTCGDPCQHNYSYIYTLDQALAQQGIPTTDNSTTGEFSQSSLRNSDQQRIFAAVENSYKNIFKKRKVIHIPKFSLLYNQQNKALCTTTSYSKKFILNLSRHVLTDSEEADFMRGLNFVVTNPHSKLAMARVVQSTVLKLPQTMGMEFM
jgi:hypothetical protein